MSTTRPPTTPPAIAPIFVSFFGLVAGLVGEGIKRVAERAVKLGLSVA